MRAIRVHAFGAPENLVLEDVEDPVAGEGQLVVEIGAAGVNPVDTYIRSGAHLVRPTLPYTPGEDGAGIVVARGPGATALALGERVYVAGSLSGTYAELALCAEAHLHPLPAGLSYSQGAAVGVGYLTAYRALFQVARATPGESVLVRGASGGVGIAAVQLARAAGLRVFGTAGSPAGRDLVLAEGAHHVLDHHGQAMEQELLDLTHGRGVDVILEMLANRHLERDLELVAQRGRVVVVGSRGRVEIDPRAAMIREASILGMMYYQTEPREMASAHAAIVALLQAGVARPVVACELPLAEAPLAHRQVLEPGARGRIVLLPGRDASMARR